jgi:hypothetical protein
VEHIPNPNLNTLFCTYVGFYIALVQSQTVRLADLAQNLAKINKTSGQWVAPEAAGKGNLALLCSNTVYVRFGNTIIQLKSLLQYHSRLGLLHTTGTWY